MNSADVVSEPDQPQFKLDIRSEPIHEEGLDTLSNMASTLRAVGTLEGDS